MSPEKVMEADRENVTLRCDVIEGDPAELQRVRWYLHGAPFAELPECNGTLQGETAAGLGKESWMKAGCG